ncbi:hypothetical protein [Alicyclobacillus dauci]|uniref:Uncharacterized protein n=1 Tax=Alicyclobacillus dauci TaxID=1475485 RepID=A0ABY6Z6R9_9BACL|nr:hypothetical protein [Alicyclobacillus dauci]WAH37730.1 hypothetical protein NZD86_04295 [Alicyclobacillus dauci]
MADFTIIDTDITKLDNTDLIPSTNVLQTIVGGEVILNAIGEAP